MSINDIHPEDKHPIDPIIKFLGNVWFVSILCLSSVVIGIFLSVEHSCWSWFSRFGSVVTIAGLLLMNSTLFSDGIYLSHGVTGSLPFKGKGEDQFRKTNPDTRRKGNRVFLGIIYAIIGTLIWGFGDLVSVFFGASCN